MLCHACMPHVGLACLRRTSASWGLKAWVQVSLALQTMHAGRRAACLAEGCQLQPQGLRSNEACAEV